MHASAGQGAPQVSEQYIRLYTLLHRMIHNWRSTASRARVEKHVCAVKDPQSFGSAIFNFTQTGFFHRIAHDF